MAKRKTNNAKTNNAQANNNANSSVDLDTINARVGEVLNAEKEGAFLVFDVLHDLCKEYDMAEIGLERLKNGKTKEVLRSPFANAFLDELAKSAPAPRVSEYRAFLFAAPAWGGPKGMRAYLANLRASKDRAGNIKTVPHMRNLILALVRETNTRARGDKGKTAGRAREFNKTAADKLIASMSAPKGRKPGAASAANAPNTNAAPDASAAPDATDASQVNRTRGNDQPVDLPRIRHEVVEIGNRGHRAPDGKSVLAYDVSPILKAIEAVIAAGPTVPVDAASVGADAAEKSVSEAIAGMKASK